MRICTIKRHQFYNIRLYPFRVGEMLIHCISYVGVCDLFQILEEANITYSQMVCMTFVLFVFSDSRIIRMLHKTEEATEQINRKDAP